MFNQNEKITYVRMYVENSLPHLHFHIVQIRIFRFSGKILAVHFSQLSYLLACRLRIKNERYKKW